MIPFHASGNTIKISASTASTNMAVETDGAAPQVQISNEAASWANVIFGSSTVTSTFPTTAASSPGYMVPPSSQVVVTPGTGGSYAAVSLSSAGAAGAVYFTPGSGS